MEDRIPIVTMSDDDDDDICAYDAGYYEYSIQICDNDEPSNVLHEYVYDTPEKGRSMKRFFTEKYPNHFIFVEQRFF